MSSQASTSSAHSGSVKSYLIGLGLCFILTGLPFYWVMVAPSPSVWLLVGIIGFALVQIMVQLVYFLHLFEIGQEWTIAALLFTLLILLIVVGGSLWIMRDLNFNMMSF